MSATTTEVAPWSAVLLLISRKFKEYIIWRDLTERKKLGNELTVKRYMAVARPRDAGAIHHVKIVTLWFFALKH